MRKNPWLWAAIVMQLLTAAFHSLSFVVKEESANATEQQIHDLITTYKKDLGLGFAPTFWNLFTALSSCMIFLCLLAGFTNLFLVQKKAPVAIIKGVVGINVIIFGAAFAVMLAFTFIIPIACFGLIFLFLLIAWFTIREKKM
jgi:hypothetical protein